MANTKGPSLSEAIFLQVPELKNGFTIKIGVASGSTYPDGQSVADVAYWDEYGTENIPARPTISLVPFKYGDEWRGQLESILKSSGWKVEQSLEAFANMIVGQVKMEINNLVDPPLSPYTIKKKGSDKPLIDTGLLLNSYAYQIEKK